MTHSATQQQQLKDRRRRFFAWAEQLYNDEGKRTTALLLESAELAFPSWPLNDLIILTNTYIKERERNG